MKNKRVLLLGAVVHSGGCGPYRLFAAVCAEAERPAGAAGGGRMGAPGGASGGVWRCWGAQMLQVVIAFIPGEPVELIAGALYGSAGGLGLCLVRAISESFWLPA